MVIHLVIMNLGDIASLSAFVKFLEQSLQLKLLTAVPVEFPGVRCRLRFTQVRGQSLRQQLMVVLYLLIVLTTLHRHLQL